MSRSYNQTSIPWSRGRKTVGIKTKRLSSKKVRRGAISNRRVEKITRQHFQIDK